MIIKLSTGKELTLEEAKEVYDKMYELMNGKGRETYIPYPAPIYPPMPWIPYPNEYQWTWDTGSPVIAPSITTSQYGAGNN